MWRDPRTLANESFDVIVIGGGAFGAAAARAAALRGLKTALIERADFGQGASAECFKMVHGGIRYLQHADITRARASCRERAAFLRTAPHLVKPLPIAIPTYGHGRRSKWLLRAGMHAYDVLTLDRNRRIADRSRRVANASFLSRREALDLFPQIEPDGLTGAAVFEDGQMHNPARLVLSMVKSAAAAGASVCNYVEATELLFDGDAVRGVRVVDRIHDDAFEIAGNSVLNAAGPWAEYLLHERLPNWRRGPFSRDAYFIIDRKPSSQYALAVTGLSRDHDAVLSRAQRHLFLVPWRDKTLVGVWHRLFPQHPDRARIEPEELKRWLDELNAVNPQLNLRMGEITFGHCGLVPFGEHADADSLQFGKETRCIDHLRAHGIRGLVTLIGIRYTMARVDAEHALDVLLAHQGLTPRKIESEFTPIAGGSIEDFPALRAQALKKRPSAVSAATIESLLQHHGADYTQVLQRIDRDEAASATVPGSQVIAAEIQQAVDVDMAVRLADVVLRRTDLSGHEHPGRAALQVTAQHMARLSGWSAQHIADEIAMTEALLDAHHAVDRTITGPRTEHAARIGSMLAALNA